MKFLNKISIQKTVFYIFLVASAAFIIGSLCFVTSSWTFLKAQKTVEYESFWKTLTDLIRVSYRQPNTKVIMNETFGSVDNVISGLLFPTTVTNMASITFASNAEGVEYYRNLWFMIQNVNNLIFYTGCLMLVLTAICGITGCFSRRKYYISNLVSGVVTGGIGIVLSIITIIMSSSLMSKLNYVKKDIDLYYEISNATGAAVSFPEFTSSNCLIGIIIPVIFIILCGGLIAYTILKYKDSNKSTNKEAVIND